jgi:hypothetical protein
MSSRLNTARHAVIVARQRREERDDVVSVSLRVVDLLLAVELSPALVRS